MTDYSKEHKALVYQALVSIEAEQYEEAIATCEKVLAANPNAIEAIVLKSLSLGVLNKPEEFHAFISHFDEETVEKVMTIFQQIYPIPPAPIDIDALLDLLNP